MSDLVIRIKKKSDGSAALSCTRADGSVTWQRQDGRQGLFFPLHDLTHFAVETVLGFAQGFYGLLADGWDMTDFGHPWPRGPVPRGAAVSELLVGFLDAERAAGQAWTAGELNDKAGLYFREHGIEHRLDLTEDSLARIRHLRQELFERWRALPAGDTLVLEFERRRG